MHRGYNSRAAASMPSFDSIILGVDPLQGLTAGLYAPTSMLALIKPKKEPFWIPMMVTVFLPLRLVVSTEGSLN